VGSYKPGILTGLLVRDLPLETAIASARANGHAMLAVHDPLLAVDPVPRLDAIRRAGLESVVWTVNDPPRAKQLLAAGALAIITDDPRGIG
jgi:glycerophosphoryl diester phosphodiesterase